MNAKKNDNMNETWSLIKWILKNRNRKLLVSGIVAFLIMLTPLLFAKFNLLGQWSDFTNTGQIGDTIGGITAPFIGFLGAILVYLSFKEQMTANQIQSDALKEEKKIRERDNNVRSINDLLVRLKQYEIMHHQAWTTAFDHLKKANFGVTGFKIEIDSNANALELFRHYIILCAYFYEKINSEDMDKATRDIMYLEFYHELRKYEDITTDVFIGKDKEVLNSKDQKISDMMINFGTYGVICSLVGKYCSELKVYEPISSLGPRKKQPGS